VWEINHGITVASERILDNNRWPVLDSARREGPMYLYLVLHTLFLGLMCWGLQR